MVAAVEGDSQQAAVLNGAAEALSERLGALHHAFDSVFATKYLAAARIDERTWAAARVAGHQMPIASVLEPAGRQLRTVTLTPLVAGAALAARSCRS